MRLIISMFMLLSFVACTKKRDESFVQGQGRDLMLITDYDGQEFTAETGDSITDQTTAPKVSNAEKFKNELDQSAKMKLVDVKTEGLLLGESTPFLALPNTKDVYKIRYQIKKDHLVVLKVAKKENIHISEITSAVDPKDINGKDDLVYIPIVGYPLLGLYNTENVDQNGQKSNKLIEVPAKSVNEAKYFKVDLKGKVLYSFAAKADLFTKEYFTGVNTKNSDNLKADEWFYSTTVVSTNYAEQTYNGYVLSQSSKVRFVFNQNDMTIVNVNYDPRIDVTKDVNQDMVDRFSISWKDYSRLSDVKKNYSMNETENTQTDWSAKKYFRIDLASAQNRIVDVELDKNYFSYTTYNETYKVRIKYSFMRDQGRDAYSPKKQFESDFAKFGFFSTEKHEINNFEKYKKSDYGNNVFVNRYNTKTKDKTIRFYFTEGSEEALIPHAAKACDSWSDAFQQAGVDIKVVCMTDKKDRKSLGDIRYNQINLFKSDSESNLFGYGPSVTDPRTGEIISATTNIHSTSIFASLVDYIREYSMFKADLTSQFSIVNSNTLANEEINVTGDKVSVAAGEKNNRLSKLISKFPLLASNGELKKLDYNHLQVPENKKKLLNKNFGREFSMDLTGKHLNKDIEEKCQTEMSGLVDLLKKKQAVKNENELLKSCANRLLPDKMYGTLLHEMGHNFGLRHNFYGSVDAVNFWSKKDTNTIDQVRSSSVMEYPSFSEDRLTRVGMYDIAALRYGYADTIEVQSDDKNTQVVKLKTDLSIDENLSATGSKRRAYKFCTDEDIEIGEDPMCARHDAGTTADEIVDQLINEYNDTIIQYNHRLNRQRLISPERLTSYRVSRFWIPMKNFYDQWRYRLNDHLGLGNEYLENYDSEKLKADISSKITTDPEFAGYQKAADKIFKFAMQMATLPPTYCIGDRNGNTASIEFAEVRRVIMAVDKYVPNSCMDSKVVDYIKNKYFFTPTSQSGYELEDVRLDSKIKVVGNSWFGPILAGPDIIGLMPEKDIAMTVLTVRAPLSLSASEKRFLPNFMDEPAYRDSMMSYFADRITKGINGKRLKDEKNKEGLKVFLEKFKYEKRSIENMSRAIFYDGLNVPEKKGATQQRKQKFAVQYTSQSNILDRAKYKVLGLDGVTYYAIMSDEATEAKKLMQILETVPKRLEAAAPVNEKTFLKLDKVSKETLPDQGKPDIRTTVQFFKGLLEEESGSATTEEKELSMQKIHWRKLFPVESSLMKEIMAPSADGESITLGTILAQLDIIAKKTMHKDYGGPALQKFAAMISADDYILNQNMVAQKIKEYREITLKQQKEAPLEDFFNYDELKTQLDMIVNVLNSMRNQND